MKPLRLGYFGKIPGNGDFVSRGISRQTRQGLDHWLNAAMEKSRNDLGKGWLDAYLTGPIWRFALRGIFNEKEDVAGVLIPSVDKINRHFPFCVLAEFPELPAGASALGLIDPILSGLEGFALQALEPEFDLERFDYDLMYFAKRLAQPVSDKPGEHLTITDILADEEVAGGNGASIDLEAPGVFWTEGSDLRSPGYVSFPGLPPPSAFSGLLRDDDPFEDLYRIWIDTRDITEVRSNNGISAVATNQISGLVRVDGEVRMHDPAQANTGWIEYSAARQSLVICNGRLADIHDAHISRFVCSALCKVDDDNIGRTIQRVQTYLKQKYPSAKIMPNAAPAGLCVTRLDENGSLAVFCTEDFKCSLIDIRGTHRLIGHGEDDDEPTLRVHADGLPASAHLEIRSPALLAITSPQFAQGVYLELITGTLHDMPSFDGNLAHRLNEDAVLGGAKGQLALAFLKIGDVQPAAK